jgi:hypothetical protein
MSKTIKGVGNDTVKVKNHTVVGVLAAITLEHGTANTAVTNAMFDATKTIMKMSLIRGGKSKILASDNLKILVMDSSFQDGGWDVVNGTSNIELVAPAVGVFARRLLTYQFDLHAPVNLRDGDELKIEMTVNNGTYSAVLNTANSQIEFSEIQGYGNEIGLPIVESYALNTGDSQHTVEPRDNVKQISLINLDKTDNLEASAVVSQKALNTTEISITRQYLEICTERTEEFTSMTLANLRLQSFILAKGEDLDKCSVDLQLNSGNVAAGKNYIVVRRLEITPDSLLHGRLRSEEKSMLKDQKLGMRINSDRLESLMSAKKSVRRKMRG